MTVVRQMLTTAMATIALGTALTVTGGATASATAQACPGSPNHAANGEGYGIVNGTHSLRTGPSVDCSATNNLPSGTKVWLWCYVVNSSQNTWYWVREENQANSGWMYAGNMTIHEYDDNGNGRFEKRHC
ncbi:hypothetical protein [Amycolatopsis sp. lyj-109]|uniref:hypothetical protein n=1 Tax=Amycolatopsis sp. lyj-109 TaxID=2789287 RepID=UPI00397B932F